MALRIEPMLEEAVAAEDARHETGEENAEGAQLEYSGEPPMAPQPSTPLKHQWPPALKT